MSLLTVKAMADHLGKSVWTINKWARIGKLPARKVGNTWRFNLALVEKVTATKANVTEREITRR